MCLPYLHRDIEAVIVLGSGHIFIIDSHLERVRTAYVARDVAPAVVNVGWSGALANTDSVH